MDELDVLLDRQDCTEIFDTLPLLDHHGDHHFIRRGSVKVGSEAIPNRFCDLLDGWGKVE